VRYSTIHKEKIQQNATMYQNFIIPYLYEAQHVSGDTPPIIRSLKLHWQPAKSILTFCSMKKPEAASEVLGS